MILNKFPCIISLLIFSLTSAEQNPTTYRAATVQYDEPKFEGDFTPLEVLLTNAGRYAEYVTKAAQQKADIIVFPEFGLSSILSDDLPFVWTRDGLLPYFQYVPAPEEISWNPCLYPSEFNNTEVLQVLSCSAKNNSIAIVANLFSKEDCNSQTDLHCPNDGRYQYDTNIVFDKNGTLIARYYKKHQYFLERYLNSPMRTQYSIFIIDGVEFATFTDFDIMYKDPAVELIDEYMIKNIIFPTSWCNEMPYLLAPQISTSWARGLGVNLIVSNYYRPQYTRLGSGIYSSQHGSLAETFDVTISGKLLIADVPIHPDPTPKDNHCLPTIQADTPAAHSKKRENYTLSIMTNLPSFEPEVEAIHKIYYQSLTNFTTIFLNESQGSVSACHKGACCNLDYETSNSNADSAVYALLVYDGYHHFKHKRLGIQTCSVMRCEDENNIESCGRIIEKIPVTQFSTLSLTAQFEADVVLPSVLLPAEDWVYSHTKCEGGKSQSNLELKQSEIGKMIIVAGLYGRLYDKDYEV